MKMKYYSGHKLFALLALLVFFQAKISATPYLVQDSYPWGYNTDQVCMDAVFGAGGWIQANTGTPAATIFQASTQFVMLEGSNNNSSMPGFISANITLIENWVNNGGRLFMNAGPNYCCDQNWGFSGTTLSYGWYAGTVSTTVPGNQIFTGPFLPTATTYSGSSFAHAYIIGTGLTPLLYDVSYAVNSHPVLCYKTWGNGIVFFGGCTLPFAWSPQTEGYNLWKNIFSYVNTFPLTGLSSTVTGSPWCAGANITVNYSSFNLAFAAGNQFKVQLSDAAGSFATPTQIGSITSTATSGAIACTIPAAQAGGTAYRIRTVSTSAAFTGNDNGTNLTINPQLVPAVTITASPSNSICSGSNTTFTATPTNGGPSPSYQWYVGVTPVGSNSPTYNTTTLANGNVVTCVMTSNAICATPTTATSNAITMTVNPLITPTVTVTSVPAANNVCVGQLVTFTAAVTNAGPGPTYQWYKNGNPVGTNSNIYTDNLLSNNDIITCVLTSNAPCLLVNPVTSAPLTITVNPVLTPSVSVTASPGNTACAGANVTFTATPVNGGPAPSYQWYVGATPVGPNSPTYSTTTLVNGNTVKCVMTSSAPCASPATATSNVITMTINPVVTPTINVTANPGNSICVGTSTTFTAAITNGGPAPTYQWTVNNVSAGTNSNTFTTNTLANGDVVKCTLLSSAPCPNPASVSSSITMTVTNTVPASVGINVSPGTTICSGSLATFTATAINGGPTPVYQWYKNGIPVGLNNAVYTDNGINSSDILYCTMTSSTPCATPATTTSNNITMLVNPTVVPSVSVSANTGNTICAGTSVTFNATSVNGGNAPLYQWYLNGNPVGGNSATYINNALANGDAVYCTMTSNAVCPTPAMVTSSTTTMTVNPLSYPSVNISASPATSICSGTLTTFTATPANGGPSPTYQWYKNNVMVGTNNPVYTDNTLNNSDQVICKMTSSATCATPPSLYSNNITMTVIGNVTPTVTVTPVPGNTICAGSLATFNTQIANGGPAPTYVWKVNNNPVGGNTPSYSTTGLNNGDIVTCELTSSYNCAVPLTVVSSPANMTVNAVVNPSITITNSLADTLCRGDLATFTATAVNGGPSPVYVWKKNGGPVGNPSPTYSDNNLSNGDIITCDLLSSDPCPVPAQANSNAHTITVNEWMNPKVYLAADPSVLTCSGSPITFNATVDSAGLPADLSYQWMLNDNPVGTNTSSYTAGMLNAGDKIYYIMTSSALCLTKAVDTSATDTIKWFSSGYLAGTTGTTESNTVNIATNNPLKVGYTDCDLISTIKATGANPVSGTATFKVTLDPQVNSYGGHPYLQRHYDIEPQNNPSTATATIELYAYENEFLAYNSVATQQWLPVLPTNRVDNGNTRITIFHGTGSAPGNYSGPTQEITPNVSWDIANNWWVMSFPATGFSGYYIHTGNFPLGVSNTTAADGFSITAFPNPVQDKVEVKLTGKRSNNSSLVVTDLMGKTLINVEMDNNKAIIDMSGLASGMYMLHYSDDTRKETIKITKQ